MHNMTKTCPKCAVEYRWEIVRCADCGETLIATRDFEARGGGQWQEGAGDGFVKDEKLLLSADEVEIVEIRNDVLEQMLPLGRRLAEAGIAHRIDIHSRPIQDSLVAYRGGAGPILYAVKVRQSDADQARVVDQQHQDAMFPGSVSELPLGTIEAPLCPACGGFVKPEYEECPDCGIVFSDNEED